MSKQDSLIHHLALAEKTILDLEAHIEEMVASRSDMNLKYSRLKTRFNEVDFNKGELEQLKIENGKLQVELNNLKKNRKVEGSLALEKLKEIERVLKYKS